MSDNLGPLVEHIVKTASSAHELKYELKCLQAWRRAALSRFDFGEGDRVAIRDTWTPPRDDGWGTYWECMMPGQTGIVQEFVISPDSLRISALTKWDTEWWVDTCAQKQGRPPRRGSSLFDYDGVTPKDRRHVFYFPVEHLRARTDDDHALAMPVTAEVSR